MDRGRGHRNRPGRTIGGQGGAAHGGEQQRCARFAVRGTRYAVRGTRYADQRHYAVPRRLVDLHGPDSGLATLDPSLDWSGDSTYNLDDPGDLQVMYQTVLNQAATADDLARWLNADTLRRVLP